MHIGKDRSKSKAEAVIFATLGKTYKEYDTMPNLVDKPDLKNQALQARKAFQAMLPKVFWKSLISLK
eukprot:145795-Ditylum_brightwellii.AAC.1